MVRDFYPETLAIIGTGAEYITRLTLTPPGGAATEVELSPGWSVTESGADVGARLGVSSLTMLPTDGIDDLFEMADYPGTVFDLSIGVKYGLAVDWARVMQGRTSDEDARRSSTGVTVSLVDSWAWCDGAALDGEYATTAGVSRANSVAELLAPVVPGMSVIIDSNGGYIATPGVYTGSRSQAAANIAKDGLLRAGFNGSGDLVIAKMPAIDDNIGLDWTFRTEQSDQFPTTVPPAQATIVDGSLRRKRAPLETLYNAVIVRPGGSEQTWTAQTAKLADTTDPRHENNIGFRPFEITSETIDNPCDAMVLAQYELTRLLRSMTERVSVTVLMNPFVEKYDTFYLAALPTLDDKGWNGTYLATSVTHSPKEATTTIEGISARAYNLSTG